MSRWWTLLGLSILGLVLLALPLAASDGHDEHAAADGHDAAVHVEDSHGHDDAHAAGHGEDHGGEHEGGGVMGHLEHHLLDSEYYDLFGYTLHLPTIPGNFGFLGPEYEHGFQITKHMVALTIAALLSILFFTLATSRTRKGEVPKGFGNFLEVLVLFIRDEVVYANLGKEHGRRWLPYFLTIFFLILFANLFGMVPWGATATGNINFTLGLALANLVAVIIAGIAAHGFKYLGTFIPHGVPIFVAPILFPIEVFGLFVKHFALTIRLFANMLAGHTIIGVFLALIAMPLIALAAVPGAAAISVLELFVAFLQAYVFVMLGSIFVGASIHAH